MSIRIILADDHRIVREGLQSLLASLPAMEVIADAEDGPAVVKLSRELRPDLIIMDIGMPELNGMEATRQIRAECPQVKVVALSMHSEARFVTEMFKACASAYLLKDSAFEELACAIGIVLANGTYITPELVGAGAGG